MGNRYFEFAMVLATLAGFAGIICSLMLSSFYQIQGQKIDILNLYENYYNLHPTEQINETQINDTMKGLNDDQKFTSNLSIYLLTIGAALSLASFCLAILGFFRNDELEHSN